MMAFIYGKTTKETVLKILAQNNYKLHEYDPRLCYNYYTFIVTRVDDVLVTRTYFFDEDNILLKVTTK